HAGIDNNEVLRFAGLVVQHLGDKGACVANEIAARLENDCEILAANGFGYHAAVLGGRRGLLVLVGDAEAATEVEVADARAGGPQLVDQREHFGERVGKGGELGQLAADVAIDADNVEVRQGQGFAINGA